MQFFVPFRCKWNNWKTHFPSSSPPTDTCQPGLSILCTHRRLLLCYTSPSFCLCTRNVSVSGSNDDDDDDRLMTSALIIVTQRKNNKKTTRIVVSVKEKGIGDKATVSQESQSTFSGPVSQSVNPHSPILINWFKHNFPKPAYVCVLSISCWTSYTQTPSHTFIFAKIPHFSIKNKSCGPALAESC